jgi:hypothetical protein
VAAAFRGRRLSRGRIDPLDKDDKALEITQPEYSHGCDGVATSGEKMSALRFPAKRDCDCERITPTAPLNPILPDRGDIAHLNSIAHDSTNRITRHFR